LPVLSACLRTATLGATLAVALAAASPAPAAGPRAERYTDGWCGTRPDTADRVLARHRENIARRQAQADAGLLAPEAILADRLQQDIIILDGSA
jgi:hypothetical protein